MDSLATQIVCLMCVVIPQDKVEMLSELEVLEREDRMRRQKTIATMPVRMCVLY